MLLVMMMIIGATVTAQAAGQELWYTPDTLNAIHKDEGSPSFSKVVDDEEASAEYAMGMVADLQANEEIMANFDVLDAKNNGMYIGTVTEGGKEILIGLMYGEDGMLLNLFDPSSDESVASIFDGLGDPSLMKLAAEMMVGQVAEKYCLLTGGQIMGSAEETLDEIEDFLKDLGY